MARAAQGSVHAGQVQGTRTATLSITGTGIAADQLLDASWCDKFSILRTASAASLYASHAPGGLSHFVFTDNSFLVSCEWGSQFLAVNPADSTSWDAYIQWMAQRNALEHILVDGPIGVRADESITSAPRALLH